MEDIKHYDNTMIEAYRRCPRKFYFRHVRHWTPDYMAKPLAFGLAWHNAMDAIWKEAKELPKDVLQLVARKAFIESWTENNMPTDDTMLMSIYPRTPGRAGEMLGYYIDKYYNWFQTIELMEVEISFTVPICSSAMYMGRLDKVYRAPAVGNRIIILDHKTTSVMANSWFESFSPNSQIDGYTYAGKMLYGDDFWGIMIDGASVMKGDSKTGKSTDRDMPPGISFPRIPMSRALNQLDAWHWETTESIADIQFNIELLNGIKDAPFMPAFPKNTTSCFCYGRCIYADICKMIGNPHYQIENTPAGFVEDKWDPRTLNEVKGE